jgi:hypothetical protein
MHLLSIDYSSVFQILSDILGLVSTLLNGLGEIRLIKYLNKGISRYTNEV